MRRRLPLLMAAVFALSQLVGTPIAAADGKDNGNTANGQPDFGPLNVDAIYQKLYVPGVVARAGDWLPFLKGQG